jgi:hypothetical protein
MVTKRAVFVNGSGSQARDSPDQRIVVRSFARSPDRGIGIGYSPEKHA